MGAAARRVRDLTGSQRNIVISAEAPPSSVVAFNIGLVETFAGYSAYLAGADRYDPDDDDWACDEAFTPRERYVRLPVRLDRGPNETGSPS
jgi:hypothetical protein